MDSQSVYRIFLNLKDDNLCFGYQGDFTDDMTEKIVALSEHSINNLEEAKKLRKKVSFLMAESFQNIVRHADSPAAKNRLADKIGMFMARSMANSYYIVSSNIIENKFIESIRSRLERVNNMSGDELKSVYMEILSQGDLSAKGGAGLGFIEMARKSGQQLKFYFEKVNDQFSLFYLGIKLKAGNDELKKTSNDLVLLDFAKDFHQQLNKGNILMIYKGDFSRESILPLLKVVEENMERNIEEFKIKKKVFYVLIELLQNISKHAWIVNGIRDGIFMIGKKDRYYQIMVGNLMENSSVNTLKTKLGTINALDSEALAKLYKTTLLEGGVGEKGGAGVGFIDIARSASEKMDYAFIPFSDGLTFFSLNITV